MQQKPRTIGTDGSEDLFHNVQETNVIHRLGEPDVPEMTRTIVYGPLTRGTSLTTITHTHLGVDLCGGNFANPGLLLKKNNAQRKFEVLTISSALMMPRTIFWILWISCVE